MPIPIRRNLRRHKARVNEAKLMDVPPTNPLAKVSGAYGRNKSALAKKGTGFDRPLNDMSAPYGAYSLALRSYSIGQPVVSGTIH